MLLTLEMLCFFLQMAESYFLWSFVTLLLCSSSSPDIISWDGAALPPAFEKGRHVLCSKCLACGDPGAWLLHVQLETPTKGQREGRARFVWVTSASPSVEVLQGLESGGALLRNCLLSTSDKLNLGAAQGLLCWWNVLV